MGAISSMCCESDKDSTVTPPIPPLPKAKPKNIPINPKSDTKVQNSSYQNGQLNPLKIPEQQSQTFLKQIEQKYPLPKDKKTIKWEDFEVTHRIGCGGFGQVFLGQLKQNKEKGIIQKYAIKRIPKSQIFKRKLTSSIQLEKKILHQSKCNFITALHYAFRDSKYLYLVMEWAKGGDTYSLINDKSNRVDQFKKAGEPAVRFILACLILGMEYLHAQNIMYRDLKPQNILIFENGYLKLTDFGLAKQLQQDELSKTEAGTTIYYAPEMVLRQGYGRYIDLWTIGIFAYEMSNYSPPFSGPQIKDRLRVKRLVLSAEKNRTWKNQTISEELKDFINGLLKFDPKERLGYKSWDQIKSHKFFTVANFNWKQLEQMKMKSPIKSLVQNSKLKYKTYSPTENTKAMEVANSNAQKELEGWTYANG